MLMRRHIADDGCKAVHHCVTKQSLDECGSAHVHAPKWLQVVLYCFDCLYLNGRVLMREPLHARRAAMLEAIEPQEGKIAFATYKTSRDLEELQRFLDEAVDACTEGLIVKTLADTYEPSKRSLNWLKLKKDYLEGVGDTFDVVVIGALHGKGKRTGARSLAVMRAGQWPAACVR